MTDASQNGRSGPEFELPEDLAGVDHALVAHLRMQQQQDAGAVLAAFAPGLSPEEQAKVLGAIDDDILMVVRAMRDLGNPEMVAKYPNWGLRAWRSVPGMPREAMPVDKDGKPIFVQVVAPSFASPAHHNEHQLVTSALLFSFVNHASARTLMRLYGLEFALFRVPDHVPAPPLIVAATH